MTNLEENLHSVLERIAVAAQRAGRDPADITLVAVTKTRPSDQVRAAYELGLRHFGENRVEELTDRMGLLPDDVTWHMIGHIQGRKAAQVVGLAQFVHSVDSLKLATRLDARSAEQAKPLPILLEINISGEESKFGFAGHGWWEDGQARQSLLAAVRSISELPHLSLRGLMTMAPIVADPEEARPVFANLRRLRDELARALPHVSWEHLSMGMTDDFQVAVEEGATMVRVGRAIFAPDQPAICGLPAPAHKD